MDLEPGFNEEAHVADRGDPVAPGLGVGNVFSIARTPIPPGGQAHAQTGIVP